MWRAFTSAKLRKIAGVLVWICGVIYLVRGWLTAELFSSWWGWAVRPSAEVESARFRSMFSPVLVVTALIFAVGLLLLKPGKLNKWITRLGICALVVFLALFLWPVKTHVSGNTRINLLKEDGKPLVGLRTEETWRVSGYFDRGGTEVRTTDETGTVEFPHRQTKGSVGMRLLRRGWAYAFLESTRLWEPGVYIKIDLPPGYWLPVGPQYHDLVNPYFNSPLNHPPFADPPLLYCGISNLDPLHPYAWIDARASGIANDEHLVLNVRPANPIESKAIQDDRSRQDLLKFDTEWELSAKGGKR